MVLAQPEVRTLFGYLLFAGEDVWKRVGMLSACEKVRLALAKTLLRRFERAGRRATS